MTYYVISNNFFHKHQSDTSSPTIPEKTPRPTNTVEINNMKRKVFTIQDLELKILFWTKRYGKIMPDFEVECPRKCKFTSDRSTIRNSDAVIFHLWDITDRKQLPVYHDPKQPWVLYNMEPPIMTSHIKHFNDVFNVTMTYRIDSDVYVPYGYIRAYRNYLKGRGGPWVNYASSKTKKIAWFVSSCKTKSGRNEYVEVLKKYIQVDIYGRCGDMVCSKEDGKKCLQMLQSDYYFYLSFENSLCQDYITEKVWDVMKFNVIPVVYGAGNYARVLPTGSYIDIRNFTSAQKLAEYLMHVSSNEQVYNSYFTWHNRFEVVWIKQKQRQCALCNYLYRHRQEHKEYHKLESWWNRCHKPSKYLGHVKDVKFNL